VLAVRIDIYVADRADLPAPRELRPIVDGAIRIRWRLRECARGRAENREYHTTGHRCASILQHADAFPAKVPMTT
jgi:hypothetical protein